MIGLVRGRLSLNSDAENLCPSPIHNSGLSPLRCIHCMRDVRSHKTSDWHKLFIHLQIHCRETVPALQSDNGMLFMQGLNNGGSGSTTCIKCINNVLVYK